MLYRATPDEMKLVLIDPKRLELGSTPISAPLHTVVTDAKVAATLRNATREMERRLKILPARSATSSSKQDFDKPQSFRSLRTRRGRAPPASLPRDRDRRIGRLMMSIPTRGGIITRLAQMARGRNPLISPRSGLGGRNHRLDQANFPPAFPSA